MLGFFSSLCNIRPNKNNEKSRMVKKKKKFLITDKIFKINFTNKKNKKIKRDKINLKKYLEMT
jgi:hypothetical protein